MKRVFASLLYFEFTAIFEKKRAKSLSEISLLKQEKSMTNVGRRAGVIGLAMSIILFMTSSSFHFKQWLRLTIDKYLIAVEYLYFLD